MLGLRIAALRKSRGWSQAELAQRLQISPSAVGMYEQSRREPSLALLVEMAAVFSVTTDFLLMGKLHSQADAELVTQTVERCTQQMRQRLQSRSGALSTEEFAVLLTAVLAQT